MNDWKPPMNHNDPRIVAPDNESDPFAGFPGTHKIPSYRVDRVEFADPNDRRNFAEERGFFGVDRTTPPRRFVDPLPEPRARDRARALLRKALLTVGFWLIRKGGPL